MDTNAQTRLARFKALSSIDVSKLTETRSSFSYLSWSTAWNLFKLECPSASYQVKENPQTGGLYFSDPAFGIMVRTSMTVEGETHEMWLSVMDGANRALKLEPYTYEVKEWDSGKWTGKMIEKTCPAASMTDINKAIMRCLVKNMAMFGLGLEIYCKGDLPDEVGDSKPAPKLTPEEEAALKAETKQKVLITKLTRGISLKWHEVIWPWGGKHKGENLAVVATSGDKDALTGGADFVAKLPDFEGKAKVVDQFDKAIAECQSCIELRAGQ